jgi:RES domain-containing protein
VDPATLATGWRNYRDYYICQTVGNDWYDKGLSPVLKVPSAVLITNFNFVLNAQHPDFPKIKLVTTTELLPDERIEDILKKYSSK